MTISPPIDRFTSKLLPGATAERLADGFVLTEGPVWHPDGYLLFSEIPSSSRRRWTPGTTESEVVAHPTNRGNGSALAPDGTLVVCEHETSVIARLRLDPRGGVADRQVIASHFEGRELNSPNDVVVRRDGTVVFTDPTYGRIHAFVGKLRDPELDFRGVFAIDPHGRLRLLASRFTQPNGLCFSPDESVLYVNDSEDYVIHRFEVLPDGGVSEGTILFSGLGDPGDRSRGFCDGMKCDADGDIWVTGPDGVWVVSAEGDRLGVIPTPEQIHNLAWGGEAFDELYLMGSDAIYRLRTNSTGAHRPGGA